MIAQGKSISHKKDGSRGLRVKSICDGVLESITSISHIKSEDLKGGAR